MHSNKSYLSIFFIVFILHLSCSQKPNENISEKSHYEHMVLSTLYAQIAAENKALQYQAFNISRERVLEYLKSNILTGKEAIIVDIDETVLETSLFQIRMILENLAFSKGWEEFINSASCKPISGALDFLRFVDSVGIKILYVTNRTSKQKDALIKNLNKYNFPQITDNNLYLKENSSNKEVRRKLILSKYDVLLFIGDSLEDFAEIFNVDNNEDRIQKVKENKNLFGSKFIVLPNSSYGTWESLIYHNDWSLSLEVQDSLRKFTLLKILQQSEY